MEKILLANALIAGLEVLLPQINQLVKSGQVSSQKQQELKDKIARLRTEDPFTGPEWEA